MDFTRTLFDQNLSNIKRRTLLKPCELFVKTIKISKTVGLSSAGRLTLAFLLSLIRT